MNMDILAVDIKHLSTYDFLQDGETEEELLKRANDYRQNNIDSWNKNCKDYPCERFDQYLKEAFNKEYRVMTWSEFEQLQRDSYINQPLEETTEECYENALNVLPPLKWCAIDGVEMFCMSEMYTGTYTNQYARYKGKYYTKMVDIMDKTTWINNYL
uniref:hypothetical protein n=1 Tax=Clostridium sp. 12(A) TaxID=1163671 RepID=UPI0004656854|nr:hypothetical protein [Clostridium sp. 12(A)]